MSERETIKSLIHRLRYFNNWRRGGEMKMPSPTSIGLDIDMAILLLEAQAESKINSKDK